MGLLVPRYHDRVVKRKECLTRLAGCNRLRLALNYKDVACLFDVSRQAPAGSQLRGKGRLNRPFSLGGFLQSEYPLLVLNDSGFNHPPQIAGALGSSTVLQDGWSVDKMSAGVRATHSRERAVPNKGRARRRPAFCFLWERDGSLLMLNGGSNERADQ